MITAFVLLLIGLLLLFIEFYLPGGIMAVLGSLVILASIITFTRESNSFLASAIFIIGVIISIALLIKYTLRLIQQSKSEYSIYSFKDQEGYRASKYDKEAIGKTGTVISDLKPAGYILVDGKKQQAISLSGYIASGNQVLVISGNEESLLVRLSDEKIKKEPSE